jgi:hypothetical protein
MVELPNIWNILVICLVSIVGFLMQSKLSHIDGLTRLVNKTREELAGNYVTRAEVNAALDRIADRIDKSILRLETKIDEMRKDHHG